MKYIQLLENFNHLSDADKKQFVDFFEKAVGKKVEIQVTEFDGTSTATGIMEKSKHNLFGFEGMWLDPQYLVDKNRELRIDRMTDDVLQFFDSSDWKVTVL